MPFGKTAIVIFGASGDLAKRKIIPALNEIFERQPGSGLFVIIGCGRTPFTSQVFRNRFNTSSAFAAHIYYHRYISGLKNFIDKKGKFDKIVFFIALPPKACIDTAAAVANEQFGEKARKPPEKTNLARLISQKSPLHKAPVLQGFRYYNGFLMNALMRPGYSLFCNIVCRYEHTKEKIGRHDIAV